MAGGGAPGVAAVDRGQVWDGTSAITRAMVLLSDCTVSHAQPAAVGLSEAPEPRAVHGRRPVAAHILLSPDRSSEGLDPWLVDVRGRSTTLRKVALRPSDHRNVASTCSAAARSVWLAFRASYQRRCVARQAIGEGSRALSDSLRSLSGVSCPQIPKVREKMMQDQCRR